MARDPLHAQSLVGFNSLGWFLSEDEGNSWCELDSDLQPPQSGATSLSLAASPARPDALFATAGAGLQLARRLNGSVTSEPIDQVGVQIDPFDSERLYASAEGQLVSSVDGGPFEALPPGGPTVAQSLVLDPQREGVVYVLDLLGRFWRSRDRGQTWSTPPVPWPPSLPQVMLLATTPPVLYVSTGQDVSWRSSDGGESFEEISTPGGELFAAEAVQAWGGSCGPSLVDAIEPDRLLVPTEVGLIEVARGELVGQRPHRLLPPDNMHEPALSKAASDDLHFAAAVDGRLFLSADGAEYFDLVEPGFAADRATFDRASPSRLFVTSATPPDFTIYHSVDFGKTFARLDCGGCASLQLDELTPGILYAGAPAGSADSAEGACWHSRSQDLGQSWQCIWPPQNDVRELCGGEYPPAYDRCSSTRFATDPRDSSIIYVLGPHDLPGRIGKSTDAGLTWTRIGPDLTTGPGSRTTWRLDPALPDRIIASGLGTWRSDDAGETWTKLSDSFSTIFESDPQDPETLYGVYYAGGNQSGLSLSRDGGMSWVDISAGIPACASKETTYSMLPSAASETVYAASCVDWFTHSGAF